MQGISSMKITLGVVVAIWVFDIILVFIGFIVNHDSGKLSFMTPVPVSSQRGDYDPTSLTIFLAVLVLGKWALFGVEGLVRVSVDVAHLIMLNPCLHSTVLVDERQSRLRRHRMVEMSFPACHQNMAD